MATTNGTGVLGPDGKPYRQNGRPPLRDGDQSAYDDDGFLLPHHRSFASIINLVSRTYSYRWDEALKHSTENALAMRRDVTLMDMLRERQLPTAQAAWHLEPEEPTDPMQQAAAALMTKVVKRTPRFTGMRLNLLEALWYGRYGVQCRYEWEESYKGRQLLVCDHRPVNGDKIQFGWDGTPSVFINYALSTELPEKSIVWTDRVPVFRLEDPRYRQRFIIHRHETDDADYFEGEMAGAVQGVGIRSRVYWGWWVRNEVLGWLMDYLERAGLGLTVFYYDASNPAAKEEAELAARQYQRASALAWPRYSGGAETGSGIERLEASGQSGQVIERIMAYFDEAMRRYIVGQTLSAKAESTGLGSSVADLHADTKSRLLRFDAEQLDETLTTDLVKPLQEWNYGALMPFCLRFVTDLEKDDSAGRLEAVNTAWSMGVEFKEDEVRELTGMSKPELGDKTVSQAKQAAAMPAPVPQDGDGDGLANEDGDAGFDALDGEPEDFGRDGEPERYAFDEAKHHRGQPQNAGQFGPGGGGSSAGGGSHARKAAKARRHREIRSHFRAAEEAARDIEAIADDLPAIHFQEPGVKQVIKHAFALAELKDFKATSRATRLRFLAERAAAVSGRLAVTDVGDMKGGAVDDEDREDHKRTVAAVRQIGAIALRGAKAMEQARKIFDGPSEEPGDAVVGPDAPREEGDEQRRFFEKPDEAGHYAGFDPNEPRDKIGRWTAGAGEGRLYETRKGRGESAPEVAARGHEARQKDDATWGATYLRGEQALDAAEAVSPALARLGGLAYDVVRANTPDKHHVTLDWKPKLNQLSIGTWDSEDESFDTDGPVFTRLRNGAIGVTGKRGRVVVPAGATDEEAAQLLHKVQGYKSPTVVRPEAPREDGGEQRRFFEKPDDEAEGRWVTIGGRPGPDGKKHVGGSPVFIRGGVIEKGHGSLKGKKIDALKDTEPEKPLTKGQRAAEMKAAKLAEVVKSRQEWGKKARKAGVTPAHLHQLAAEMIEHDRAFKADRKTVLQRARKLSESYGVSLQGLQARAARGSLDAAGVKNLDQVASSMAAEYPEHFAGSGDDPTERLFDLLIHGNPEPMTEDEAYAQALDHLEESKSRELEAVPFGRRGEPGRYAGFDPHEPRDEAGRWVERSQKKRAIEDARTLKVAHEMMAADNRIHKWQVHTRERPTGGHWDRPEWHAAEADVEKVLSGGGRRTVLKTYHQGLGNASVVPTGTTTLWAAGDMRAYIGPHSAGRVKVSHPAAKREAVIDPDAPEEERHALIRHVLGVKPHGPERHVRDGEPTRYAFDPNEPREGTGEPDDPPVAIESAYAELEATHGTAAAQGTLVAMLRAGLAWLLGRYAKKGEPDQYGRVEYVRAPRGGARSPVNGHWYPGGEFMPVHGKSESAPGKSAPKKPEKTRKVRNRMGDLVEVPEGHMAVESLTASTRRITEQAQEHLGLTQKQVADLWQIFEMEGGSAHVPKSIVPPSAFSRQATIDPSWDIMAKWHEHRKGQAEEAKKKWEEHMRRNLEEEAHAAPAPAPEPEPKRHVEQQRFFAKPD